MKFEIASSSGRARSGEVTTRKGTFATPCFMPVGTRAGVRSVSTSDIEEIGFQLMLANTYHLMLRPGAEIVGELGGISRFSSFSGSVLTDSGGFQVFSLKAKYDEEGVSFKSVYDGSTNRLTPEGAVDVQDLLGSDIQMVLDVCSALPSSRSELTDAMDLTLRWAERARTRMDEIRAEQDAGAAIFGIVQGGDDVRLRKRSAESTVAIGFDGYGIGGLSVGEPPDVRTEALDTALEMLPRNLPRYLMGVGDPVGLLEAISSGVDMFDCVLPTRLARHGTLLTDEGKVHLKRAEFARDSSPIDRLCGCKVCSRWSRAYLRHLLMVGDPTFQRLASIHNLYWMFDLLARARSAISSGNLTHLISGMKEAFLSAEPISDEP